MSNSGISGFKRPAGPANVWKKLELVDKSSECDCNSVLVSIQDVPNEKRRFDEAKELMINHFVPDEPMCSSINITKDPQALIDFKLIWDFCLEQGITVGAYRIGNSGELLELVGVNMLFVSEPHEADKQFQNCVERFKSPKSCKVFSIMQNIGKMSEEPFRKFCYEGPYISAMGLCVLRNYRGQKLGVELLKARDDIGKKFNIRSSSTIFTALGSQIQAERAGYTTVFEKDYDEIVDELGQPAFPGIKVKSLKVMVKRLF